MEKKELLMRGFISGMEQMGATFVKYDCFHIYFKIKKGTELDNEEKLKRAQEAFMSTLSLGLKIHKY